MKKTFFILLLFVSSASFAQVKIGGTPGPPDPTAVLELDGGATRGLLLPRMRKVDLLAIVEPAEGLVIYTTDEESLYLRRNGVWVKITQLNDAFALPYLGEYDISTSPTFAISNPNVNGTAISGMAFGGAGAEAIRGNTTTGIAISGFAGSGIGGYFLASPNSRGLIVYSGRTGLGTSSPDGPLHIDGAMQTGNTVTINDDDDAIIQLKKSNVSKGFIQLNGDDLRLGTVADNANGSLVMRTAGADRVFVNNSGNMLIGGATPPPGGHKLAVKGAIAATAFNVVAAINWPDYVFDKSYKLRSLDETENFINANKHLPGIPPASEIEKNGYEITDMQKRMMEKIEELTLHLIEANKEIKELKTQMAELQKK